MCHTFALHRPQEVLPNYPPSVIKYLKDLVSEIDVPIEPSPEPVPQPTEAVTTAPNPTTPFTTIQNVCDYTEGAYNTDDLELDPVRAKFQSCLRMYYH